MENQITKKFISEMKERGYDICKIDIVPVSKSCYVVSTPYGTKKVPYLKIFTIGRDTYDLIKGKHENLGLVDDDVNGIIRELWDDCCRTCKCNITEVYDKNMYIGMDRIETYVYAHYAYEEKAEVEKVVEKIIGCKPRQIYASTMPGVNIVFHTSDYARFSVAAHTDELVSAIRKRADKYVKKHFHGMNVENVLKIQLWHPEMRGYNGYGLARQD